MLFRDSNIAAKDAPGGDFYLALKAVRRLAVGASERYDLHFNPVQLVLLASKSRKSCMSKAEQTFQYSIRDAEELLAHFDSLNEKPPPASAEVLKRAGLVMALTAWETYVEDRAREALGIQLKLIAGSRCGDFMSQKLENELKRFNTPNSSKTRQLFVDYLGVDVTESWIGLSTDAAGNRKALDTLIFKRGQAVHRSKVQSSGPPSSHLVKRDELEKAIRFIKLLVEKTDQSLNENL